MADIRLITLLPPQAISNVPTVTQGATAGAQPTLANLTPGTLLTGFIVNRDATGNPILRTDSGDVTFSSNFFLKIGSEVTIRVEQTGGQTLAHILNVDGQPPEVAEKLSAFTGEPQVIVSQNFNSPTSAATPQTALGALLQATEPSAPTVTVTGTLVAEPPESAASSPIPVGSQLTLKIVTFTAPATIPAPVTTQTATANTVSYSTYARASGVPVPFTELNALTSATPVEGAAPPPENIVAGKLATPIAAPPVAVLPSTAAPAQAPVQSAVSPTTPTQTQTTVVTTPPPAPEALSPTVNTATAPIPTPTVAPAAVSAEPTPSVPVPITTQTTAPPAAQIIPATVVSNSPAGEALLQTPLGVVRLQPGVVIPTGSTITFEVTQSTPPDMQLPITGNQAPLPLAPLTELAQHWPAVQQIFSLLAGQSIATGLDSLLQPANETPNAGPANPLFSPQTPVTGQSISNGFMSFMAAVSSGDFRGWVGEKASRWLEDQGQDGVLKKAAGEFMTMSRQFTEAQPNHWQPLFFPVAVDGILQQVRLFVKRDRKDKDGNVPDKKKEETRFVLEVDLSQLGEMQLDGFVRRQEKSVQFDLMIRSLTPLPEAAQQDIFTIYNSTAQLTGYQGSLVFQSVREFPVNPMQDIVAQGMGDVVA